MERFSKIALAIALLLIFGFIAGKVSADGIIHIVVNGNAITSDVPPQIINGRVMVPISAVASALGCTVNWNAANQEVDITSSSAASQISGPPGSSPSNPAPSGSSGPGLSGIGDPMMQPPTTVKQANLDIAYIQQEIAAHNLQVQSNIDNIKTNYDPKILNLQNLETQLNTQAAYGEGAATVQNEIEGLNSQIKLYQQEEQTAINDANQLSQVEITSLQSTLTNDQTILQHLNSDQ